MARAIKMGATESPAQTENRESVRQAIIRDVHAPRPAVPPMDRATRTAVKVSTCLLEMELFRLESAPQVITGDVAVPPFVAVRTVLAIRMDVMGSTLPMEVQDFVPQGTILDVCAAQFAERQTANARPTAVKDRTEFAPRGIILAASVIIRSS
jgi:hypothetical protein